MYDGLKMDFREILPFFKLNLLEFDMIFLIFLNFSLSVKSECFSTGIVNPNSASRGEESGAAVTDPLGGSTPKRLRTAGSVVAGAGWASTVEELVQQAAGRLVQQAKAGNASAGMVVDAVLELLGDALGVASPLAGSSDTAVVMALGAVYKQLTMKRLNEGVAVETARDL